MERIDDPKAISSISWLNETIMLKRRLWRQERDYAKDPQGIPVIGKLHTRLRDIFVPFDYEELK